MVKIKSDIPLTQTQLITLVFDDESVNIQKEASLSRVIDQVSLSETVSCQFDMPAGKLKAIKIHFQEELMWYKNMDVYQLHFQPGDTFELFYKFTIFTR